VLASIAGLAMTSTAEAQNQTKVIVNTDVEVAAISQAEIARIYLGKKKSGTRAPASSLRSWTRNPPSPSRSWKRT
jgi:hypothetical protein